jgi:tellurite methyltransferase
MSKPARRPAPPKWSEYYRWTARRPPRDLLLQLLNHIEWERKSTGDRTAIELGFGAGTDTLELLRRGWRVLAIDEQESASRFLARRVPRRSRSALTTVVAPMQELDLPSADLVYASFSLPFCPPAAFPALWSGIRRAIKPGGHFGGQLFGNRDEWRGERPFSFHTRSQVRRLARGMKIELLRETVEDGRSFESPKHWHFFDLILEKPRYATAEREQLRPGERTAGAWAPGRRARSRRGGLTSGRGGST